MSIFIVEINPTIFSGGPITVSNLLPTLQLLYTQGVGGRSSVGANEAFMLEAKLRRRYVSRLYFKMLISKKILGSRMGIFGIRIGSSPLDCFFNIGLVSHGCNDCRRRSNTFLLYTD